MSSSVRRISVASNLALGDTFPKPSESRPLWTLGIDLPVANLNALVFIYLYDMA